MKIVMGATDLIDVERDALEDLTGCDLSVTDCVWLGTERPVSHTVVPLGNMIDLAIMVPRVSNGELL